VSPNQMNIVEMFATAVLTRSAAKVRMW
jgi:hypothetical protein